MTSVLAWSGMFAALMVAAGTFAITHIARLDEDPGPLPALAIVIAGLSFATLVFHLMRLKPALRLRLAPPERDVVERHLATIE